MTLEQRLKDQTNIFSDYHVIMSNNNARKKLLKASNEASDNGGVQHVLAILDNVSFYQNLKYILNPSRQDMQ